MASESLLNIPSKESHPYISLICGINMYLSLKRVWPAASELQHN